MEEKSQFVSVRVDHCRIAKIVNNSDMQFSQENGIPISNRMKKDFDGQIVSVIGGEISIRSLIESYTGDHAFMHHGKGVLLPGAAAQQILSFKSWQGRPDAPKDNDECIKRAASESGYDADTVAVLMDGKMQLTCLLNSPGGTAAIADEYCRIHARQKTVTMASTLAASAAAEIFVSVPRQDRYAMRETELMWHGIGLEDDPEEQEEIDDALDSDPAMEAFIKQSAEEEDRRHIQRIVTLFETESKSRGVAVQVRNILNARKDFIVSGKRLHALEMTNIERDVAGLRKRFEDITGLHIEKLAKMPVGVPIHDFFRFSALEERCRAEFGLSVRISMNGTNLPDVYLDEKIPKQATHQVSAFLKQNGLKWGRAK